jgi:hypothetical protein
MGIQIHDYFAGRRPWGQMERILLRLPRHSHYKAALDDDEEFAAIALKLALPGTEKARPRVPLAGYSDVIARLDNVFDAISALHETMVDVYSRRNGRRVNRTRAPRPETAQQRLRRAETYRALDSIVEQMTGGR